jgi:hypothetical protein
VLLVVGTAVFLIFGFRLRQSAVAEAMAGQGLRRDKSFRLSHRVF